MPTLATITLDMPVQSNLFRAGMCRAQARVALAKAAYYARFAQSVRTDWLRSDVLAATRDLIAEARTLFAESLRAADVRHSYRRAPSGAWRAVLAAADGRTMWRSCRVYAHRQSAQRAALAAMAGWLSAHY